jgi:hypothetical protein
MQMSRTTLLLVFLLVVGLPGCKPSREQRAKDLMREGNTLLEQSSKLTNEWTEEYQKVFNPESRAKFPGNRDELRTGAETIITILDEASSLERRIANNYEEASTLSPNAQER